MPHYRFAGEVRNTKNGGSIAMYINQPYQFTERNDLSISNGNRTEWSPIRSVIMRVITKSDDRAAGVRFVYREYD